LSASSEGNDLKTVTTFNLNTLHLFNLFLSIYNEVRIIILTLIWEANRSRLVV